MTKHVTLGLLFPILAMVFIILYTYRLVSVENIAFESFTMEKKANYAADAAVEEILYTGDLGMDYADNHKDVQPDLAVREYCSVLLSSMGLPSTDYNIMWLQQHNLKCIIICTYDGFYLYMNKEVKTGETEFVSTPKIPYFYTAPDGTQYCLNLGFTEARWDSTEGGYHVNTIDKLPSSVTRDIQLTAINNEVSKYLQYGVSVAYGGHYGKNYELPAFASQISGGQPVNNITIIAIQDTDDVSKYRPNLCMSIGGARIVQADPIIGFTLDGVKYYAKQSMLVGKLDPGLVEKQFNNEYEAARNGYNFFLRAYE